jgi:hypothetical protein
MYGKGPRDKSQYARCPCRHTRSVACPAMGSRVLAFLLLVTFWGAWVPLIGSRPCALSYLLWR